MDKIIALLILVVGLQSCTFNPPSAEDLPVWSPEIFGPVAKLDLSLENLSDLVAPEITRVFLPEDLGVDEGTSPVPPFQVDEIGPINFQLDEAIEDILIEQATVSIFVNSSLPIDLNAGSRVELRNSNDEVVVAFDFDEGLPANSSVSKQVSIRNEIISSNIQFYVFDLSSDGSFTPVTIDENTNISVTLGFEELIIQEIGFKRDQQIVIDEQFEFTAGQDLESSEIEVEGEFRLSIKNGFPLQIPTALQVYDAEGNLLFELFNDVIEQPQTNSQGRVSGPNVESNIEIPINQNQIELLKEAAIIRFFASIESGSNFNGYTLEKGRSLFVKLISNIALTID